MNDLTGIIEDDMFGCLQGHHGIRDWVGANRWERCRTANIYGKIINPIYINCQLARNTCHILSSENNAYYFTRCQQRYAWTIFSLLYIVYLFVYKLHRYQYKHCEFRSLFKITSNETSATLHNLIVVAHPDDEILWFGEFLLEHARETKVLCITHASTERSQEFQKAMTSGGCAYEMWDFEDGRFDTQSPELLERLRIAVQGYENVYTHSLSGEYGHPQHILVSKCLFEVTTKNLFVANLYNWAGHISPQKQQLLDLYKKQNIKKYATWSAREDYLQIK